jgi:hypothetical protein
MANSVWPKQKNVDCFLVAGLIIGLTEQQTAKVWNLRFY